MTIEAPIKRIVRNISSTSKVYIRDIDVKLEPLQEINLLTVQTYNNRYYRTLSEIGNSHDLDLAIQSGFVEVEDENGTILTTSQAKRATWEATLWDVDNSSGSGGGGGSFSKEITQNLHGFSVGNAIYFDGSNWLKAKADHEDTLGIGIVSDVDNTNTFTVTFTGIISGLSGLVAGEYYFVSTTSAGNLTSTKPINGYENPILFATDTNEGIVFAYRPSEITDGTTETGLLFTDLDDAPASYSGYGGYLVKVKDDESGLEFIGDDTMLAQRINFISDDEYYTGTAPAGSATSASVWRIKKTVVDSGGEGDVTVTWADGNANFDNVWNNHLSLSYS